MNHLPCHTCWSSPTLLATMAIATALTAPVSAQTTVESANPARRAVSGDSTDGPVAVLAVSSYDQLIADITFMGNLAGRPEIGQMLEGFVALFTQGKGLAGLDKGRPWGVVVQTDGEQFHPVGCLPLDDVQQTLSLVQAFGVQVDDAGTDLFELELPNGQSMYVKDADGWAFLSYNTAALESVPANPLPALGQLVENYDVGIRVAVQQIPQLYRQLAIDSLRAGMQEGLEQQSGEEDDTFEMRQQMAEAQLDQLVRLIEDVDELTVGWAIDALGQRMYLDFASTFVAGSTFSKQLEAYRQAQTNFAGFYQPEAAFSMTFVNKADPELMQADIEQFKTMMRSVREQAGKEIDKADDIPDEQSREVMKEAVNDFMDAIQATIESGHMDGGAVLSLRPDAATLVAGGRILEPAKIESGIKKLVELAKNEPDFPGISWNAASHAGINFHTIQVPIEEDEDEARRLLGPTVDIALGIGADSVYVAVGRDHMTAVKRVIDASQAAPNKKVPPMEFTMSLGQIMDMVEEFDEDEDNRRIAGIVAEMLRNDARGRDHIRMVAQPLDNGFRYRLEAEEGVLRAIGKAADAAQQQGAANQF